MRPSRRHRAGAPFIHRSAGAAWRKHQRLAEHCHVAGLTQVQAEAARLAAEGYQYREIAGALDIDYRAAKAALKRAAEKVLSICVDLEARRLAEAKFLLRCVRNSSARGGSPLLPAARPFGAVAEDIANSPLGLFRSFG